MPNYDDEVAPPAPVALVDLRNSETGAVFGSVRMLLDTGADVTLLPYDLLAQLGVPLDASQTYELAGFDGRRSTAIAAHLDLVFVGSVFRGRYLVIDHSEGILGRDVLNWVNLGFDGPALQWNKVL